MYNLNEMYVDSLENVTYGDGYNILIHGVQSALGLLDYFDDINANTVVYGYFGVETENMIIAFQKDNNLPPTGKLDAKTYSLIFDMLKQKLDLAIVQTKVDEITIISVDTYLELSSEYSLKHPILDSRKTLTDTNENMLPTGGKSFKPTGGKTNGGDLLDSGFGNKSHPNLDFVRDDWGTGSWYDSANGDAGLSLKWEGGHVVSGSEKFDDLVYNYVTQGNKYFNGVSYSYNLGGSNYWNDNKVHPNLASSANRDYDFINNLLANSMYANNYLRNKKPLKESKSTDTDIGKYSGEYEETSNSPFFNTGNISNLRQSKFDIKIVYGAKGEFSRMIKEVTPISVSQEMDASGEPVYDIYEFVAKDVVYNN